jgi:hypothetical protein
MRSDEQAPREYDLQGFKKLNRAKGSGPVDMIRSKQRHSTTLLC